LALEPSLIIADEPVSALDVSVQARLDLTLVFITHDLRLVRHLTHRVAVMYLGRIVEIGPTASLLSAPRQPYTQALVQAVPQLKPGRRRARAAVSGELPSPLAPPAVCAFHPRCPSAQSICGQSLPALETRGGEFPTSCHFAGAK